MTERGGPPRRSRPPTPGPVTAIGPAPPDLGRKDEAAAPGPPLRPR
ncbi:hypothetical protein [Amycolatopsis plumensis]